MAMRYHIVPKGDGYHLLGCGMTGKFFLIDKGKKGSGWEGECIFETKAKAQEFIDKHNLTDYIPEKFWLNEGEYAPVKAKPLVWLTCPDCGFTLETMVSLGADETNSNTSESLLHCRNCLNDYNVCRDNKGRFIKMTRHFWG